MDYLELFLKYLLSIWLPDFFKAGVIALEDADIKCIFAQLGLTGSYNFALVLTSYYWEEEWCRRDVIKPSGCLTNAMGCYYF